MGLVERMGELVAVTAWEEVAEAGALVAVIGVGWAAVARDGVLRARRERRARVRSKQATSASEEASWDEPAFAADTIRDTVLEMLTIAERVWRGDPPDDFTDREDRSAIENWIQSRNLSASMHFKGRPAVDVLRVVNRVDESEDRAVVRVRGRVTFDRALAKVRFSDIGIDDRWTLGRHGAHWNLLYAHGDPLADQFLAARSIASGAADDQRLLEASFTELAASDRLAIGGAVGELIESGPASVEQLGDLSIVDGRFLPALIEAQLVHLIEAWEEATVGSEEPLVALTDQNVKDTLLEVSTKHGPARLILQDAVLQTWTPTTIRADDARIAIEVTLTVTAVRYVIAPSTGARLAGSNDARHEITLNWTLKLTDQPRMPWRLTASDRPGASIPWI